MSTSITAVKAGSLRKMRDRHPNWKHYWIMLLPALIWMLLFQIFPMFGIVMAFQDFDPGKGFLNSKFVGLANFKYMFSLSAVRNVLLNTILISIGKIIGNIIVPLVFALLLNEVRRSVAAKFIQTAVYLPHFLSWVILSSIILQVFGANGPINSIITSNGGQAVMFFQNDKTFPWILIISDVWKNFGYNSIIYLAALTGIDMSLYEAAAMDGAGRWKQMLHVTLPGIAGTVVLMAVLSMGSILDAGFDQVFNLYNPLVYRTGDIIDTYVYRAGIQELNFSFATTVGLLKSIVSFILIICGYWTARKTVGYRIF